MAAASSRLPWADASATPKQAGACPKSWRLVVACLAQKPVAVVLNGARVNPRVNDEAQAALQQYEVVACPVVLPERIDDQHSFTQGMTAPEFAPRGAAALERWIAMSRRTAA